MVTRIGGARASSFKGDILVKKIIKLSKRHPKNAMQFSKHIIKHLPQEFELNESEIKALKTDGPKYWFSVEDVEKVEKKVIKKVIKKATRKR